MKLGYNDFSASDVINKLEEKDLSKIFKYFGDEKEAKLISKNIIKENLKNDTNKLVTIIEESKKISKLIVLLKYFKLW